MTAARPHTERKTAPAPLVPALALTAVAALLWLLGRHEAAIVALVAALVVPQLVAVSPRFARGLQVVMSAVGHGVGLVLGALLLTPLYVLVLLPAGLLSRVLHSSPVGIARTAGWQPRSSRRVRADATFAPERAGGAAPRPEAAGRGHVLRVVLAVLAVQALLFAGFRLVQDRRTPEAEFSGVSSTSAIDSAALRDLDWAPDAFREAGELTLGGVYTPFYGYSIRDYEGEHITVQNRVRGSYVTPLEQTQDPVEIWFFGGSTMFGFDLQRDEHTIASEVVRLAEEEGIAVRARNFGAPGYVNYQETLLLAQALTAGGEPDLVVFYDGINDKARAWLSLYGGFAAQGEPGTLGVEQIRRALVESDFIPGATTDPASPLQDGPQLLPGEADLDHVTSQVIDVYAQGIELAEALAQTYDFELTTFWQPDLYTRSPLDPAEEEMLDDLALDPFRYDAMTALSDHLSSELPEDVVDISWALDDLDEPVFSDVAHINEVGGRAVAEAMWSSALQAQVSALASS